MTSYAGSMMPKHVMKWRLYVTYS